MKYLLKIIQSVKNNSTICVFLFFITLLSIFFRVYNVENSTRVFSDTGRDLLVAKKIVKDSEIINPYLHSSSGLNNTPVYYWLVSILWLITDSIQGTIILNAMIIAIVSPFIFFLIGKEIYSKYFGIFLAFYFSIQPYFVERSRWVWQPNSLILIAPILFLLFIKIYKNLKNYNSFNLALYFLIGFLMINVHISSIVYFWYLSLVLLIKSVKNKQYKLSVLISFLTLILTSTIAILSKSDSATNLFLSLNLKNTFINFYHLIEIFNESFVLKGWHTGFILKVNIFLILLIGSVFKLKDNFEYFTIVFFGYMFSFITVVYPSLVSDYFFLPSVFLVQLSAAYLIYNSLIKKSKLIKTISLFILTVLVMFNINQNWRLNHIPNDIELSKIIVEILHKDIIDNAEKKFSILVNHNDYGPAGNFTTSNAIIWLQLELLEKKSLVKLSSKYPTIIEPEKFDSKYIIEINSGQVNFDNIIYKGNIKNHSVIIQKRNSIK